MNRPIKLTTERLLLRPFTLDDVGDVLEYNNDPEWARYQVNILPHPFTRKDAETLVAMFSNPSSWEIGHPGLPSSGSGAGLLQIFAIVLEDKVIGEICLNQRDEDRQNERAELVYSLSRQHWGKGLMTEGPGRSSTGHFKPTVSTGCLLLATRGIYFHVGSLKSWV